MNSDCDAFFSHLLTGLSGLTIIQRLWVTSVVTWGIPGITWKQEDVLILLLALLGFVIGFPGFVLQVLCYWISHLS